jgi:hypothetical protein
MKMRGLSFLMLALFAVHPANAQISTSILRPVGYHPSNIAYFNTPYFSNALYHGGEWYSFPASGNSFGTPVNFNTAQFVNGYPQFLNAGEKLRALLFGLNINDPFRPAAWPARDTLARGRIVVTWNGNADIRLVNGTFVLEQSNGPASGNITNGRRIYLCTGASQSTQSLEVHSIVTPPSDIKVWLPPVDDPATPANENLTGSLEGQMFHPLFLQRIADADWGFIRFMDWGATNASPQQDWTDRRLPAHIFMNGIINSRQPAPGVQGDRETGVAYEHIVALCNATNRNLWINIPHLASADFMTKLAKLIRFGSDGINPYDAPQANPVFPPLAANLKVYVEYSNEIWSSGFAFPQGNWAEGEAAAAGLTKPQFTARKFCDTWRIFQSVFGGTSRLVRVAAVFTALDSYSRPFLQEMATYGVTLNPAVRPDVMALTTYFGNDIQGFVNQKGFTAGKLFNDPYWTSATFASHLTVAFDEWKRRILSGDAASGSGPDATGIGGGFSSSLRTLPNETLGYALPIIAYEGGPSLFTDNIDQNAQNGSGVPTDDGVTTFIEAMNRDPRIADVYRIHLEIAKSKGLWTHTPYTDTSTWSRFGQWGHLETLDQNPASAPKYSLMLQHFTRFSALRHIDEPLGLVPQFVTGATLPVGIAGQSYTTDITTSGGNGARTVTILGSFLDPGLALSQPSADMFRVSGAPTTSRKNFIFASVNDADGDPAWRIFTLETFGGPGTLVQSDFRGTSPALNLPWTQTFVLSPKVTWSGWNIGAAQSGNAGVTPRAGDNAFVYSVSGPAPANEPLSQAITDNEFLVATLTPAQGPLDLRGAEIRFSTKRLTFHAALGYALFTSIGGFAEANAHYVSTQVAKDNFDDTEHVLTLPATAAFSAVNAPLQIRIYAFGTQFDDKNTSMTAFKMTQDTSGAPPPTPSGLSATAVSASSVLLTWTASANASGYEIGRRFNGGAESVIGTSGAPTFTDSGAPAATAFVYRVRAIGAGGTSSFSNPALATTVLFTDDPIVAGSTVVKRAHLVELRSAVNAVRATAGLTAQTFTDASVTAGVTMIRAVHIAELRTALNSALTTLAFSAATFGNSAAAGTPVRGADIQELRNAVK